MDGKHRLFVYIGIVVILCMLSGGLLYSQSKGIPKGQSGEWVNDPGRYVDPFIGTAGANSYREAGNTVPGAVMPFGMFNFGPETAFTDELLISERFRKVRTEGLRMPVSPGGYNHAARRIKGFSFTRLSGTGCLGASGDVPIFPFVSEMTTSPELDVMDERYSAGFRHADETARPGYYRVVLDSGIAAELTATPRTGLARFSYPKGHPARLLIRSSYSQLGSGQAHTRIDPAQREITGQVTSGNFCGYLGPHNRRDYYTLYFIIRLDCDIAATGCWQDGALSPGSLEARGGMGYGEAGVPKVGRGSGGWVELSLPESRRVNARVGISYVSLDNARLNLEAEQDLKDTLETLSEKGYRLWNDALGRIQVETKDAHRLRTFYTALYHAQFHPNIFSDVNGEYAGFDGQTHCLAAGQEAQYANFSGWDVYRSQLQLVSLLHPRKAGDIAQSLYNQASQYGGVWDRWTHNNGPTAVMCGDPATIAIANFVAFGCTNFDLSGAYASLVAAAKTPTPLDLSPVGKPIFSRGQKPSLDQWLSLNYISEESHAWEGASETLEQCSAYFALSQLAGRLQDAAHHHLFLRQSANWKKLFNPNAAPEGGYIQGRHADGRWKEPFDPSDEGLFVEGSPRQYLWMVPFDGQGLVKRLGGEERATGRLNAHFKKPDGSWALQRAGGQYSDVSNQPSLNAPWMYLFTGQAHRTVETVRATLDRLWTDTPSGIPGQDDLGQMSSWYVFSSLGLYPLYPGRSELVLSSPLFHKARIKRAAGDIVISVQQEAPGGIYIQKLRVDDRPSEAAWIDESYIRNGVRLQFVLGPSPNPAFGRLELRPPSFATEK